MKAFLKLGALLDFQVIQSCYPFVKGQLSVNLLVALGAFYLYTNLHFACER